VPSVDTKRSAFYPARSQAAPSSNGKTTDSDSVNRGSNPRGASIPHRYNAFRALMTVGLEFSADGVEIAEL
jgi:hypothetical protein